jgi:uncharacterized protein YkwD
MLAALFSVAAVAGTPAAANAAGNCVPAPSWPAARADLEAQVITLVNAHRAQLGLAALVVSPALTATAEWKARDMAAYDYFDHDDLAPDPRTAGERLAACGYPAAEWGENLATGYDTAQAVVDAWLASPEHRANIEAPDYRATGVGAAGAPMYWAESFGAVADAGSAIAAPVALPTVSATAAAPSRSTAPAVAAHRSDTTRPVRVSCAQRGHGVACRVLGRRGTMVRIALMRSGRTFARARTRTAADAVRVRLHPMRRLRAGRYALVVHAGPAAGGHVRRMSMVLR